MTDVTQSVDAASTAYGAKNIDEMVLTRPVPDDASVSGYYPQYQPPNVTSAKYPGQE